MSEAVIILHGIARTSRSMKHVSVAVQRAGYTCCPINYPATRLDLNGIANWLHTTKLTPDFWTNHSKVHFVTHSMGGLVARTYLDRYRGQLPAEKIGRTVMLAPPHGGSEIADVLHKLSPYKWFYGPAGKNLTTSANQQTPVPYYDLGIIAGTKSWPYPDAWFLMPRPNDGRVSVVKTKINGMCDHKTYPLTHTFIMNNSNVHKDILYFLKTGFFKHEAT
jgi:triacylglycerol lipase